MLQEARGSELEWSSEVDVPGVWARSRAPAPPGAVRDQAARVELGEAAPRPSAGDAPMCAHAPREAGDLTPEATSSDGRAPARGSAPATDEVPGGALDWRIIDRRLRVIAGRRGQLDAEEARWLRAAELHQIWRPLGMVSAIDYLGRALGHDPHTARERLRVARALGGLPRLSAALELGELSYSAVRELTRVATPSTETRWHAKAVGLPLRDLEALVAHREPGDGPDDPARPEPRVRRLRLELAPEAYALWRETARVLGEAHGRRLSDSELVMALCGAARAASGADSAHDVRDGGGRAVSEARDGDRGGRAVSDGDGGGRAVSGNDGGGRAVTEARRDDGGKGDGYGNRDRGDQGGSGAATFQIAVTVCERCRQGWQDGGGQAIPISAAAVERAMCDAQHIGSLDAAAPARATRDIPPSVVRLVRRRDHGRCRVPGCRSVLGIELHHVVHRSAGGAHVASNLVCLCSSCHAAHHDGRLRISGTADQLIVERPREPTTGASHGGRVGGTRDQVTGRSGERSDAPEDGASHGRRAGGTRDDAVQGLTGLGWPRGIAATSVDAAIAALGERAPLADLLREALRRCPRPRG